MAIKRTGNGYKIRWYDADGIERKKTIKGISREEAKTIERDILAKRDRGERLPDAKHAPLFGTFAEAWLQESKSRWKSSSLQQYGQVLKSQLKPIFGELRLPSLTDSKIRQAMTTWQEAGLGVRRLNLVLMTLKQILKAAVRQRYLAKDPAAAIRLLREHPAEIDPMDPTDIDAFLTTCPTWWRPYFTVAFWTGARPNELAALKWGDLELSRHTFRIRAGRYRGEEGTPKTSSSIRDVDLLPEVVAAFHCQKAQQATQRLKAGQGTPEVGKDYVFTGPEGGLLNVNHLRDKTWYTTLTKAALRRRTMYQTRHTFASNALAAGESPTWVSRMLGHASAEMVFQVYARFIPNRTRRDGSALLERMRQPAAQLTPSEPAAGQ